jgi:preprotein translocase subunit SecY
MEIVFVACFLVTYFLLSIVELFFMRTTKDVDVVASRAKDYYNMLKTISAA